MPPANSAIDSPPEREQYAASELPFWLEGAAINVERLQVPGRNGRPRANDELRGHDDLSTQDHDRRGCRSARRQVLADVTLLVENGTLDHAKAKADLDYGQYIAPGDERTSFTYIGKNGGTRWLRQAIVAGQNPFAGGAKGERRTDVKMDNEYKPDSGYTRTSSQATTISSDMELWYSNAANDLKALSGMLAHAQKNTC